MVLGASISSAWTSPSGREDFHLTVHMPETVGSDMQIDITDTSVYDSQAPREWYVTVIDPSGHETFRQGPNSGGDWTTYTYGPLGQNGQYTTRVLTTPQGQAPAFFVDPRAGWPCGSATPCSQPIINGQLVAEVLATPDKALGRPREETSLNGIGSNDNAGPFNLRGGNYSITWTATEPGGGSGAGNLVLELVGVDPSYTGQSIANVVLGSNETQSGASNASNLPGGQYYLRVSADGAWKVTIGMQ